MTQAPPRFSRRTLRIALLENMAANALHIGDLHAEVFARLASLARELELCHESKTDRETLIGALREVAESAEVSTLSDLERFRGLYEDVLPGLGMQSQEEEAIEACVIAPFTTTMQ
ncbi:hypothetical protein R75461_08108 [Paraburkholderia nemoris]|uniref:hypothetical protein n=1 Tax=Paraburkholderia nemoris TaxID=2793076 RepID=UPI00190D6938|nr:MULTISPECIES: hypothetical protein [Paraburkholderia]MBK3786743.1 hypothetical protein [Paraburkholderia aspalathi]CAE6863384.1 hypothetical protein R75461_08108 [Paraburkholderia nemoris]